VFRLPVVCVRVRSDLAALFMVCLSSEFDWPTTKTINRKLRDSLRIVGRWRQQYDGWNASADVHHSWQTVCVACKVWHIETANDGDGQTDGQTDRRWYQQAPATAQRSARGLLIEPSIHNDLCGRRSSSNNLVSESASCALSPTTASVSTTWQSPIKRLE